MRVTLTQIMGTRGNLLVDVMPELRLEGGRGHSDLELGKTQHPHR